MKWTPNRDVLRRGTPDGLQTHCGSTVSDVFSEPSTKTVVLLTLRAFCGRPTPTLSVRGRTVVSPTQGLTTTVVPDESGSRVPVRRNY